MHITIPLFTSSACFLRSAVAAAVAPTVMPEATALVPHCIPFEDPGCCVNKAVCQCNDGMFWPLRVDQNTTGCNPPGMGVYGDATKIPGWCC
ncbi:hypothetical protein PG989_009707 [Apiospora arundinis]